MTVSQRFHLLAAAVSATLLNCIKPLHIDDAQYFLYAEHIARHPLDPYGFEVFWFQWPEPAMELLSPAFFPYWLAPAVGLFGEQMLLVKLWLLPVMVLLALAVHALARRFAYGLEAPIVWMCLLSPTILPGINLMLDVPATALSLAALATLARACDRQSLALALLAGLLAGIAIQVKYYALIGPGIMILYALVYGRLRLGLASAVAGTCVFVAWELLLFARYGESHFIVQLIMHDPMRSPFPRWQMVLPLLTNTGVLGVAVAALGIAALTRRRILAAGFVVCATLLIAWIAAGWQRPLLAGVILGVVFWAVVAMAAASVHDTRNAGGSHAVAGVSREVRFLAGWLLLEIAGYFVMAPFPAARRFIGLIVAATLLCAHAYRAREPGSGDVRGVMLATALSIALGVSIAGVDLREALAGKRAAELAAARIREQDDSAKIWFTGHWGFQHHARAAGMQALVPDHSVIEAGDWLVLPLRGVVQQAVNLDASDLEVIDRIDVDDDVPLATVPAYYSGVLPFAHRDAPRFSVALLRARGDTRPTSGMDAAALIDWARRRSGAGALGAVPALLALAGDERYRERVKETLVELGSPALRHAASAGDERLRAWARAALDARGDSAVPRESSKD